MLKINYFTKYITRYYNLQWSAQKCPLGLNLLGVLPHFRIPHTAVPLMNSAIGLRSPCCPQGCQCQQLELPRPFLLPNQGGETGSTCGVLVCCPCDAPKLLDPREHPAHIVPWQLLHVSCEMVLFHLGL